MRTTQVTTLPDNEIGHSDCNNYQTLESFDRLLKSHGLELEILDNGSSDYWFRIVEKK